MKRFFCLFLFGALALTGCSDRRDDKKAVAAGIAPIGTFVGEIAGDGYAVITLLPEGKNPHDYQPGMRELAAASKCKLFFTTALPFEKRLVHAFEKSTRIVDVGRALPHRKLDVPHHRHDHGSGEGDDPHVWLSHDLDIAIVQTIADELGKTFPQDAARFQENANALQKKLADQKAALAKKLAPRRGKEFFVYHGAFGYFADTFGLKQVAIEVSGRESDPAHLAKMAKMMKAMPCPALFVQKGFSATSGNALREMYNVTLVEVDPLAADVLQLFETLGDALARQGEK